MKTTSNNDPAASVAVPQAPAVPVRPPECNSPAERAQLVTVTLSREDLGAAHYALEMLETRLPSLNREAMRETLGRVAAAIVAGVNDAKLAATVHRGYGARSEARQLCERRNVAQIVDALLAAGYELNLNNGGEGHESEDCHGLELESWTRSRDVILSEMFATDDETLCARLPGEELRHGVFFVYGNADNGAEVASDWHVSLSHIIDPIVDSWPDPA
jgi:hypothetical protein